MKEVAANQKRIRVLMQNRPTAFSHRGGDTVLMERLKHGLEAHGVEVTIDTELSGNPADYDLVHLFNFAIPQLLEMQGRRAQAAGTPFVVSTLSEDIPAFHAQSIEWGKILIEYVHRGQDKAWFDAAARAVSWTPVQRFNNDWVAAHAAALYPNGAAEAECLRRDYGSAIRIHEVKLGHEIGAAGNADAFVQAYGVRDFVFCVGRFETRKNQLMLL